MGCDIFGAKEKWRGWQEQELFSLLCFCSQAALQLIVLLLAGTRTQIKRLAGPIVMSKSRTVFISSRIVMKIK